jgi:hypothetical protein
MFLELFLGSFFKKYRILTLFSDIYDFSLATYILIFFIDKRSADSFLKRQNSILYCLAKEFRLRKLLKILLEKPNKITNLLFVLLLVFEKLIKNYLNNIFPTLPIFPLTQFHY